MAAPRGFDIPRDLPARWRRARRSEAIRVTGRDRADFLRRILSGQVPPVGGVSRTALLTPKGALIAAGTASTTSDAILLETDWRRRDALLTGLDRYRIADDVELTPLDGEPNGSLLLQGFGAHRTIGDVLADLEWPIPEGLELSALPPGSGADLPGDGGATLVIRRLFRPWPAWRLRFLDAPNGLVDAAASLGRRSGPEARPEERGYLRIAAGEPRWGSELDEASRVAECGLAAHARLGQGCYIGQEYVARQAHRGRIPRLLRRLVFPAGTATPPPAAGLRLEGRPAGRFTSGFDRPRAFPPDLPGVGLAILDAKIPEGAIVTAGEDRGFRARVLAA